MKKKSFKKILAISFFTLSVLSFNYTNAQERTSTPATAPQVTPDSSNPANISGPKTPTPVQTADSSPTGLKLVIKNPLDGVTSIEQVIQKIMGVIVKLAIPVIICFFIYSGFMFITAQGDKKQLETAKNMFFQVVIGSIIILGAWTIATAIVNTVNLITG